MKVLLTHTRWMILELLRQPTYIVSTLAFPALFFAIFALPEAKDKYSANLLLASFSCFAAFGVLFLQFGVSVAQERTKSWYHFLRSLPVTRAQLMVARFLSSYFFALFSVLVIVLLAHFYTPIEMNSVQWIKFSLSLLLGGMVFCLMGLALGFWATEKSALPLGNLIYLPLSFAGGLWKPPNVLPEILKEVSGYLPTRHYGEVTWQVVQGTQVKSIHIYYLLAYLLLFLFLGWLGMKKDYNERIR